MADRIIDITSTLYADDNYWVYCMEYGDISFVMMILNNRDMSISFSPEEWESFMDNLNDVTLPSDIIISPGNAVSFFTENSYSVWADITDNGESLITLIFHDHRKCKLMFNEKEWETFTTMLATVNRIPRAFKVIQGGISNKKPGYPLKLYKVNSTMDRVPHNEEFYDNVNVKWFIWEREMPTIPYEQAIQGYAENQHEDMAYAEGALDELFTIEETTAFKYYLLVKHDINCHIEEVNLPIPINSMGYSPLTIGGPYNFYKLFKEKGYDLPFKVAGYIDLSKQIWERWGEHMEK